MIAIDLSKQQVFDAYPKKIKHINFTGNLENQSTIYLFIEEAKKTASDFSQQTAKVFKFYFCFNIKWLNITL